VFKFAVSPTVPCKAANPFQAAAAPHLQSNASAAKVCAQLYFTQVGYERAPLVRDLAAGIPRAWPNADDARCCQLPCPAAGPHTISATQPRPPGTGEMVN